MKAAHVIRTHRPEQGPVAFARAALGLASTDLGMRCDTLGALAPAGQCRFGRVEDQGIPGEGSAEQS